MISLPLICTRRFIRQPQKTLLDGRSREVEALERRLRQAGRRLSGDAQRQRLEMLERRLRQAMSRCMEAKRAQTRVLERALEGLNPSAVLERGYAVLRVEGGPAGSAEEADST